MFICDVIICDKLVGANVFLGPLFQKQQSKFGTYKIGKFGPLVLVLATPTRQKRKRVGGKTEKMKEQFFNNPLN